MSQLRWTVPQLEELARERLSQGEVRHILERLSIAEFAGPDEATLADLSEATGSSMAALAVHLGAFRNVDLQREISDRLARQEKLVEDISDRVERGEVVLQKHDRQFGDHGIQLNRHEQQLDRHEDVLVDLQTSKRGDDVLARLNPETIEEMQRIARQRIVNRKATPYFLLAIGLFCAFMMLGQCAR